MPNPSFQLGSGTHDSGPRAGDIGYPEWLEITSVRGDFFHPAPLLKGLVLLAGQL